MLGGAVRAAIGNCGGLSGTSERDRRAGSRQAPGMPSPRAALRERRAG